MTMIQVVCITVQWNKSFQKVKMQPWNVDYELTCQHQVHAIITFQQWLKLLFSEIFFILIIFLNSYWSLTSVASTCNEMPDTL